MKIVALISLCLLITSSHSLAQCGPNEVEIKVEINTDIYGGETYWIIGDIMGNVVLQGGQGGTYASNSTYSDSICVPDNGCFFFEIWDTYGDGIFAPNGYELYVDEVLIASGSDDINSHATVAASCNCSVMTTALNDLQDHINGFITLSSNDLQSIRTVFKQLPECLAESEAMILLGKSVVDDYENQVGPLFTTAITQNGIHKDPVMAPGLDVERAMAALQQGIFDYVFTTNVYQNYPQHINDWFFNSCNNFPGFVNPPNDSTISHSMFIRANFDDPDGTNPYFDDTSTGTEHALRPTGLYLAPGSVASVTVPDSLVGENYFVQVGSHEWDLDLRPIYRRLDRISKLFPIDSTTVEIFNPFGGAISIIVPFGADEGIVEVSVTNCLESPFFSKKDFYESPDFNAEFNKPGPWAVFETDNVMFTIPKHSVIQGQYDIAQALQDWDDALQGVNSIMAREIVPDRHNMYMISDVEIRFEAYSIGYPLSNNTQQFTDVPGPTYFLNGPGPDDEVSFHETGHAMAITKFPGEEEALVNLPYVMALNYGLGENLDTAVSYSFVPNTFTIDRTATHRMVSNTFGVERDISNTVTDEVRYQHRGYGHYFEIVKTLGWCPLRNFWKQESIDEENGIVYGIYADIDDRIIRMSVAAGTDLRPLFHVFGVIAQDPFHVEDTLNQIGITPSLAIYNRLQEYFTLIPADSSAFVNYAQTIYPNLYIDGPMADPEYGVGWHYLKSLSYNTAEAQQRAAVLQSIIDQYFPNGQPGLNSDPNVCCLLDTLSVNMVNDQVVVTGGVEPYDISVSVSGNIQTVSVMDFDGCASTTQFALSGLIEDEMQVVKIYPNPAATEIYIDLLQNGDKIESVQIVSLNGKLLESSDVTNASVDVSNLNDGLYILRVQLESGILINKRFLVKR